MALKPWQTIVTPRPDLCDSKPTDAAEFAVHLDKVHAGVAPDDYQNPELFFERTYLTHNLTEIAAEVIRRLSGETIGANAIFNLTTQFGGGKTHALTLLYHLVNNGPDTNRWMGVSQLLKAAEISSIPKAQPAIFVGQRFDPRGGDDGTPHRHTPWGEIAWQLGAYEGYRLMQSFDEAGQAPGGDTIAKLFDLVNRPILILMDELINYVSRYRKSGLGTQLYNFLHNLSEEAHSYKRVVLVVALPASELEMSVEDQSDFARFNKLMDRVGRSMVLSAESETTEIIRRRLFQWDARDLSQGGKIMISRQARETCRAYANWLIDHQTHFPDWFPVEQAQAIFEASYPFHPTVLSVFERKWQTLPNFQQTRGVLQLLALWISHVYEANNRKLHPDSLITLGTAPLEDSMFRTAVFKQLSETRLEGAVTADICGKPDSHAIRLDNEAVESIKKSRLHRKIATAIFFESNGGQSQAAATLPEIRLDVAEPDIDLGNVETALETMASSCYYLLLEKNKYRFSLAPNINKLLADRRASVQSHRIDDCIRNYIQKVFAPAQGITPKFFPKSSTDIPNRPELAIAVLAPSQTIQDTDTLQFVEKLIRESGSSDRTFKSAIIVAIAESDAQIREEARKLLAWEDIRDEEPEGLSDSQQKQLKENVDRAKRDLKEAIWRSYRHIAVLNKSNTVEPKDMGVSTSSSNSSLTDYILGELRKSDEIQEHISPRFLTRNWPPAFKEWSTKSVRDNCFASPIFPRLLDPNSIKQTIAAGVSGSDIAYVGKAGDRYNPFHFRTSISPADIEISDDMFIIKAEEAEAYLEHITEPPRLAKLEIQPQSVNIKPDHKQAYTVRGIDQRGNPFDLKEIDWSATGGDIDSEGVLTAGKDPGNFTVVVKSGDISATVHFTIPTQMASDDDGTYSGKDSDQNIDEPAHFPSPAQPTGLKWKGEVPTQKWTNFYMRVLSKFAADKNLNLKLTVEFAAEGDVSEQKRQEAESALKELGLEGDFLE